jgi:secreted trypsin-like serine protease
MGKPDQLQRATLQIFDHPIMYSSILYNSSLLTNHTLCTSAEAGAKSPWKTDSGSPLMASHVLAGIISWGKKCGDAKYLQIYTVKKTHSDFIVSILY